MTGPVPHARNHDIADVIYGALDHDEGWSSVLDNVAASCGAQHAWLLTVGPERGGTPRSEMSRSAPPELAQAVMGYLDPARNELLAVGLRTPAGRALTTDMVIPRRHLVTTRIYREMMSPFESQEMMVVNLLASPQEIVCISVYRSSRLGPFAMEDLHRFECVWPHLARAYRLRHKLDMALRQTGALDHLRLAVMQVDRRHHVLFANVSAEELLAERDGIALREGRLQVQDSRARKRLGDALAAATAVPASSAGFPGLCLAIPRPSARPSLIAFLTRSTPTSASSPPARRTATLFVSVTDAALDLPVQSWIGLWGLTRAEATVCLALVRARGLQEIAQRLGVSVHTVHTHLARVMGKTGTRKQAELVALLLSSVGQLRSPTVAARSR